MTASTVVTLFMAALGLSTSPAPDSEVFMPSPAEDRAPRGDVFLPTLSPSSPRTDVFLPPHARARRSITFLPHHEGFSLRSVVFMPADHLERSQTHLLPPRSPTPAASELLAPRLELPRVHEFLPTTPAGEPEPSVLLPATRETLDSADVFLGR